MMSGPALPGGATIPALRRRLLSRTDLPRLPEDPAFSLFLGARTRPFLDLICSDGPGLDLVDAISWQSLESFSRQQIRSGVVRPDDRPPIDRISYDRLALLLPSGITAGVTPRPFWKPRNIQSEAEARPRHSADSLRSPLMPDVRRIRAGGHIRPYWRGCIPTSSDTARLQPYTAESCATLSNVSTLLALKGDTWLKDLRLRHWHESPSCWLHLAEG